MVKKRFSIITLFLFIVIGNLYSQSSSMTDQQVLEYVKKSVEQGKEQKQIAKELSQRGVTYEQAERVKKIYEQQSSDKASVSDTKTDRLRSDTTQISQPPVSRPLPPQEEQIFGHNIFNTQNLTFEPNSNLATPPTYQLGPGDEIIIDVWGASQNTIRETISPDGTINIPNLGIIYLNGMNIKEATRFLEKELSKIYANTDNQIKVTLGSSRTIQVNVMGEVVNPGTYALSAFSTVFHALYCAGGINDIGSLRNVYLIRNEKKIADIDIYNFIIEGKGQQNIRLQEGDVVIIPPYQSLVKINGNVKRPMKYEMKQGETLETLIKYAGGFEADAYCRSIRIVRQNGEEYMIKTVDEKEYPTFKVNNGDIITADEILNRFTNKLEIRGAVYRPGLYELGENLHTLRQLIEKANGLTGDAFTNRTILQRQHEDLSLEIIPIDVKELLTGKTADIPLQKNDIFYIPSIHDLQEWGDITIYGEIARPGNYPYMQNMTLEDLIIRSGGLKDAASTIRVDISRRIKNTKSTTSSATIGKMYSFALKDGFVIDGEPGFILQPYDQIFVRRSPGYQQQQNVKIEGEVLFEGTYAMTTKNERLSDLVDKAGGITEFAYVRGARLTRVANPEEKKRMQDVIQLIKRELGEALTDSLELKAADTYTIGIDLQKALEAPGSNADVVLREGDVLNIPEFNNTIKISGTVMVPNTVSYSPGENVKYYLNQAGGYSQGAKKSKKFIIYMNGQVSRVKGNSAKQIEPGCEIIVPAKKKKNGVNVANLLGYATSFTSLGTMIASLANLLK